MHDKKCGDTRCCKQIGAEGKEIAHWQRRCYDLQCNADIVSFSSPSIAVQWYLTFVKLEDLRTRDVLRVLQRESTYEGSFVMALGMTNQLKDAHLKHAECMINSYSDLLGACSTGSLRYWSTFAQCAAHGYRRPGQKPCIRVLIFKMKLSR